MLEFDGEDLEKLREIRPRSEPGTTLLQVPNGTASLTCSTPFIARCTIKQMEL
jgi:hypothetical protein